MPPPNTVSNSNGEILTGRLWRKNHQFFTKLPFYCNVLRMDDVAKALGRVFGDSVEEECYKALLIVS
jgi:hypothetical protein